MLADAHQGERIREGFTVAIAGPPNAGKSSLLNALSGADTAIVTPIPGTTRDLLRVEIQVDGLPVRLVDTAGLRDSPDPVEQEGVRRARDQIAQSDLVLWVYDATNGPDPSGLPGSLRSVPLTRIRNKIDLSEAEGQAPHPGPGRDRPLRPHGDGLDRLHRHIKAAPGSTPLAEGAFVARRRHLEALQRGLEHLWTPPGCRPTRLASS